MCSKAPLPSLAWIHDIMADRGSLAHKEPGAQGVPAEGGGEVERVVSSPLEKAGDGALGGLGTLDPYYIGRQRLHNLVQKHAAVGEALPVPRQEAALSLRCCPSAWRQPTQRTRSRPSTARRIRSCQPSRRSKAS